MPNLLWEGGVSRCIKDTNLAKSIKTKITSDHAVNILSLPKYLCT